MVARGFAQLRDSICAPGEHILVDPVPTDNGTSWRCERCGEIRVKLTFEIDLQDQA